MGVAAEPGRDLGKFRIHWHVVLAHFPVSFFLLSSIFMALHFAAWGPCFEMAAYVSLIAGAAATLPTTLSGWLTWKSRYKGLRGRIFLYKIRIALAMSALSIFLAVVRSFFPESLHEEWLMLYALGILFLLVGSAAEGFYGGRLNHS